MKNKSAYKLSVFLFITIFTFASISLYAQTNVLANLSVENTSSNSANTQTANVSSQSASQQRASQQGANQAARPTTRSKDMFLIIDTSLSMAGVGPTARRLGMGDITKKVKKSSLKFIKDLKVGDSFTLVSFDTKTRFYKTITIKNIKDKKKIVPLIMKLISKGKDTYTSNMVKDVIKKVREFEKKFPNRDRIIIIMSDGLDDPPRTQTEQRLNLRQDQRVKRKTGAPLFVYYLHLSPRPITSDQRRRLDAMREGREGQTVVTQADPSRGNNQAIDRAVDNTRQNYSNDLNRGLSKKSFFAANWWWLLLILLGLLFLLFMFISKRKGAGGKKKSKSKMIGFIVYSDKKSNVQEETVFNMSSVKRGYVKIGVSTDDDIKLRNLYGFRGIRIVGDKTGGRNGFTLSEEDFKKINIVGQKKEGVLSYEDSFEIENYLFTIKLRVD